MAKVEQRRVRFICIAGLDKTDLSLTGEVWFKEIKTSNWPTPDVIKLCLHLMRYIAKPNVDMLDLAVIEKQLGLSPSQVRAALDLMQSNGAVERFSIQRDVRVALNLTVLDRLKILEAKQRWRVLTASDAPTGNGPGCDWIAEMVS